ncbi:hypothetical protein FACS1894104_3670 [Actinomycetota bacterium]|nr:hypothetical protein FACS1894104_3670 [Actinomycetota bacterium]
MVAVALRNIPKVRAKISESVEFAYLDAWQEALVNKTKLKKLISDESVEGLSCWQVAPFAGVFTPQERWDILRETPNR